jgi:iron(III) transport system ATP-binding protein
MRIKLVNIKKSYNASIVLEDINLDIASRGFTTFLGASGCGKTTLLRLIAGLETPDDGEIYFDNVCVFSKKQRINVAAENRCLGFVFQDFALWPHMTVFENVAFGPRAAGNTKHLAETVNAALASVRLSGFENRFPHQLSGGQQQRVAFARAIAINPRCILFDEPLSALDAILREEMRAELKMLVTERNITAVFVTHDQLEAMSMSDEIVVMNKGRIQQKGKPEEIYNNPANIFVAKFVGKSNWFNENTMIRPENILFTNNGELDELNMKVENSQFLGNTYQILLNNDACHFTVLSSKGYTQGETIPVYIRKECILQLKE